MLDFRPHAPAPPSFLGQRQQRRLLVVVLTLGLVWMLASQARNPRNWQWVAHWGQAAEARAAAPAGKPHARKAATPLAGLDAALLNDAQDDAQLTPGESKTLVRLLALVRKTDSRALAESSSGNVSFIELDEQPEAWRGKLVDFVGTVRGAFRRMAPTNDADIAAYYELWIEPRDRSDPIVVDCTDLPRNFPLGEGLDEPVDLTGIFVKRWAYQAKNRAMRSAPLLVAKGIDWVPKPVAEPQQKTTDVGTLVFAVGTALAISVALLVVFLPKRRRVANPYVHSPNIAPAEGGWAMLDDLRKLELSPEAAEALRAIRERDQRPSADQS